jgi:hypothetical protein
MTRSQDALASLMKEVAGCCSWKIQDILSNYKELFRIQFFLGSFGSVDECTQRAL